jgi:tetratricopeptide (TPR) repeat protein
LDRYDEALTDFNRAVELDPADDWCWYLCARGHLACDENAAARTHLDRAIETVKTSIAQSSIISVHDINLVTYRAACNDAGASELLTKLLAQKPNKWLMRECLNDLRDLATALDTALVRDLVARVEAYLLSR